MVITAAFYLLSTMAFADTAAFSCSYGGKNITFATTIDRTRPIVRTYEQGSTFVTIRIDSIEQQPASAKVSYPENNYTVVEDATCDFVRQLDE